VLKPTRYTAPGRVLVLGGTSEIAIAVIDALNLPSSAQVVLAGRSGSRLAAVGRRLGCQVIVEHFDARELDQHQLLLDRVFAAGPVDLALAAFGILGDQPRAEVETSHALEIIATNLTGQVSVILPLASAMRRQGGGDIVVFSSVAGVRARRANFIYGATKAGLDAFASGLTDALHGTGVHVLVVRPGFVVGRMTQGMKATPLASTPRAVARAAVSALAQRKNSVWVPAPVGIVALMMRFTPRPFWRRLRR
jgi:decaprenylphospho-beta-D-erythro-pentofuranosid-2-ulose 2-reductase